MIKDRNFSYHVARSKMDSFNFGRCVKCKNTVIHAVMRDTQQGAQFDPQPVGGTEMDRVYSRHACPRKADD